LTPNEQAIVLVVPREAAGLRLDRFLAASGRGWSRSQVARWISKGHVTRNGAPTKPAQFLQPGDEVVVVPRLRLHPTSCRRRSRSMSFSRTST
jgi:ribosomal 50S subunit-recycling heat shock protein